MGSHLNLTVVVTNEVLVCVQLVWLVRELVKSGVMGADGVIMTLLKQIAGETLGFLPELKPRILSPLALTVMSLFSAQAETSPPKTCGWLRVSWTSCSSRSMIHCFFQTVVSAAFFCLC